MPATATKLNIQPIADKVVIQIEKEETAQTSGGIIIPDTAREKPQTGVVVAVGPGKYFDNGTLKQMTVKVGDRVMFQKYGGTEWKHEGSEYKIMAETDIIGVLQ